MPTQSKMDINEMNKKFRNELKMEKTLCLAVSMKEHQYNNNKQLT